MPWDNRGLHAERWDSAPTLSCTQKQFDLDLKAKWKILQDKIFVAGLSAGDAQRSDSHKTDALPSMNRQATAGENLPAMYIMDK